MHGWKAAGFLHFLDSNSYSYSTKFSLPWERPHLLQNLSCLPHLFPQSGQNWNPASTAEPLRGRGEAPPAADGCRYWDEPVGVPYDSADPYIGGAAY